MKTTPLLRLLVAAAALLTGLSAQSSEPQINAQLVGDVFVPNYTPPTPAQPAYACLHDAGIQVLGDPVANENPPEPSAIHVALARGLAKANILAADATHAPTLLLVTHWGVLRKDSVAVTPSYEIPKHIRARLWLVGTPEVAQRIEDELTSRLYRKNQAAKFPWPETLNHLEEDTLETAKWARYFVIVSAYDYSAAAKGKTIPVWQARFSTEDLGVTLANALPALLVNGAAQLGRNTPEPLSEKLPSALAPAEKSATALPAPEKQIAAELLAKLEQRDRDRLLGQKITTEVAL